jgi:hypothetical protein
MKEDGNDDINMWYDDYPHPSTYNNSIVIASPFTDTNRLSTAATNASTTQLSTSQPTINRLSAADSSTRMNEATINYFIGTLINTCNKLSPANHLPSTPPSFAPPGMPLSVSPAPQDMSSLVLELG